MQTIDVLDMKRKLMMMTAKPRTPGWDARMRSDLIALLVGDAPADELQTVRFYEWMCKYVDALPYARPARVVNVDHAEGIGKQREVS